MAKKQVNEKDRSYTGCYGKVVDHGELMDFVLANCTLNEEATKMGHKRFTQCIWGHAGIGKTMQVESLASQPVEWRGKKFDGWDVKVVPLAQFEEMGDLHGLPYESFLMRNNGDSQWVNKSMIESYHKMGWEIDVKERSRTLYAAPDWVPTTVGPSILLLDDWNRASIRILKGIMQLLQNYGMTSWSLPDGCNIVMTGNPDEQDYIVTTIDCAHLTRIKHVTLKEDEKRWAIWAEANNIDPRVINFVLRYPEMMIGPERTNPRTLAEFGRFMLSVGSVESEKDRVHLHAKSLLDDDTVTSFMVFATRDMELLIEPDDILNGKKNVGGNGKTAVDYMESLLKRKEPRMDIFNIVLERLFAKMVQPNCEMSEERKKNFQSFIVKDFIPDEMRHSFCHRLLGFFKDDEKKRANAKFWLLGSQSLQKLILDCLRDS